MNKAYIDIPTKPRSLTQRLKEIIDNLPTDSLTLGQIRDLLGRDGMLLLVILLSLVFLIPVSIPGLSTIFGGTILLIGFSILFDRNLWLPKKFLQKKFPAEALKKAFLTGLKWLTKLEKISQPHRLAWLTGGKWSHLVNGSAIILATLLLMMPFGLIPFTNTLPALALLLYAIGLLQKDGLSILLGHLFNLITILYLGILLATGSVLILETFKYLQTQS